MPRRGTTSAGRHAFNATRDAVRAGRRDDVAVAAELNIRLQPRARANEIVGERGETVLARVTAPPVDGRANEALCALIAKRAGVAKGSVSIVRGAAARDKVVRVEGLELAALRRSLGL
jgi:uncharacterized protein